MAIAKASNMPVLFTPAELPLEIAEPIKSADEPVVAQLRAAPIMAAQPTGEEVQLAEVVTPPPAPVEVVAAAPVAEEKTLPSTASLLPLMALFGLLTLGGAMVLRLTAKRLQ